MSSKVTFFNQDDSVLSQYLKDISHFPILSKEETNILIKEAQSGKVTSRNRVMECNLRFVVTLAKQFQGRGLPLMDLISDGNLGLAHSIDLFDTERGVPFLSYASWWIKQSIEQSIYWRGREIRLPVSQHLKIMAILKAKKQFEQEYNRTPSTTEIAELSGVPESQIDFLAQYFTKALSVDEFLGGDEENSQLCDVIPDTSLKPLDELMDSDYTKNALINAINKLTVRERDIVVMLFGIGMEPVDNKIVAAMFGLGTERVRQIKEAAIKKLQSIYLRNNLNYNDFI